MIYFDYTATTKPRKEIVDLHQKITNEYWCNSETLYHQGMEAKALYEKSAKVILDTLKLKNKKLVFTSGATEANNTAIYSTCNPYIGKGMQIITTLVEHASVLKCYQDLEKKGFKVIYLEPNKEGLINPDDIKKVINNDTILISCMWVNNVIGSIEPIKEIIKIVKDYPRCKLHVDTVQGIGKMYPDFDFNDIDFMTMSAHKIEGLKGTGALIYSSNIHVNYLQGGHQQESVRPGTVDTAGAVCLGKAIQYAYEYLDNKIEYVNNLYNYFIKELMKIDTIIINRSINHASPYIVSITFKNVKGETALHSLEASSIIVGTGSACNSNSKQQEKTLVYALGDMANPINTIRISLSHHTTLDELNELIKEIKKIGK